MYTTEAIVLKKTEIGEADLLYTLYTWDFGKLQALARGIRKPGAKLRGHLETVSLSAVRLVKGRNGTERLIGASLLRFWEGMRGSEAALRAASLIADRIDKECFAGQPDKMLWELLLASLAALDHPEFQEENAASFLKEFDERLSACLGYGGGSDS